MIYFPSIPSEISKFDNNLLYFYYLKSSSLWTVLCMHLRNIAIKKIIFPLFAESELCMRLVCGPNREYTMHITDNNGQVGYAAPPGWGQTHF